MDYLIMRLASKFVFDNHLQIIFQTGLKAMAGMSPLLRHLDLDDETYGFEQKPLPNCSVT